MSTGGEEKKKKKKKKYFPQQTDTYLGYNSYGADLLHSISEEMIRGRILCRMETSQEGEDE